jgi:hypothetical protein
VDQINRDLRGKKFGHFVNGVSSLADLQVSIERAASLLDVITAYGENQRPVDAPNAFAALPLPGWPSRRAMDMIFHGRDR